MGPRKTNENPYPTILFEHKLQLNHVQASQKAFNTFLHKRDALTFNNRNDPKKYMEPKPSHVNELATENFHYPEYQTNK